MAPSKVSKVSDSPDIPEAIEKLTMRVTEVAFIMESCQHSASILEQPTEYYRFRYETEMKSVGKLTGRSRILPVSPEVQNSEIHIVPSIKICGGPGKYTVIISCVTEYEPYRPHPFGVVDRNKKDKDNFVNNGVYVQHIELVNYSEVVEFKNIGIVQTTNGKPLKEMLQHRKNSNVDPFKTGFKDFESKSKSGSKAVRLCFQVFLMGEKERKPLKPIVSEVIRAKILLMIDHVSHTSGPSYRPTLITIVCSEIDKKDIEVIFFDKNVGENQWKAPANVINVFRKHSIVCYTPLYKDLRSSAQVFIKLMRKSDKLCSKSVPFVYTNSNTSNKTLSKSLLPGGEYEKRICQPPDVGDSAQPVQSVYSTKQYLAPPPLPILKQEEDQYNDRVQRSQISQELPKVLEWYNDNRRMSISNYNGSKPSTSGMVYPLSENANSETAPDRTVFAKASASTACRSNYGTYSYQNNNQLDTRQWHQPTPSECPLPSFESFKHTSPFRTQSPNRFEKQSSFVGTAPPISHFNDEDNMVTEFDNNIPDPNYGSLDEISMEDLYKCQMDLSI